MRTLSKLALAAARQWISMALGGLLGFSVAALCVIYTMSLPVHGVTAAIGGPFTLVDDTGATVTEKTIAGKPYVMYFGYTFCSDVCPTTLLDLSRSIKKLGPDADRLNYVFVTVDHGAGHGAKDACVSVVIRQAHSRLHRNADGDCSDREGISGYHQKVPTEKLVTVIPYQEDDASAVAKLGNLVALTPCS
jgi:hypothetical protein